MSEFSWRDIIISPCETYHLLEGKPLYAQRYKSVMKYHEPGLAPVKNDIEAFHLDIKGIPAYLSRFIDTFGYYDNLAAVRNEEGWFHINSLGIAQYLDRYDWCGNFQEKICPVKEKTTGQYFHINPEGERIYQKNYYYVGDFKDGNAVVSNELGLHTHIDNQGRYLHGNWFSDLDVYHKGFARAQDKNGWFHINKLGNPIYKARFLQVEPFYNGVARVRTMEGNLITINTIGEIVASLSFAALSD